LLAALVLTACDEALNSSLTPPSRPDAPAQPENAYIPPSPASMDLARYYERVQADLLARGLLRTDGGGPDTPYDADDLTRNFQTIAFVNEHASRTGTFAGGRQEVRLSRWKGPIRIQAEFGPTVPLQTREADRETISAYAARLSRVTGHKIQSTEKDGNFIVMMAGQDDIGYAQKRLKALVPNIPDDRLALLQTMQRPYYCFVFTFAAGSSSDTIYRAVAFIRAENPKLIRLNCIHEEIAQGLGLTNDSPAARPSIFNDDDEFALLTSHDQKLLTMLYDPRLEPGVTVENARPVVRIIARELMGQSL